MQFLMLALTLQSIKIHSDTLMYSVDLQSGDGSHLEVGGVVVVIVIREGGVALTELIVMFQCIAGGHFLSSCYCFSVT